MSAESHEIESRSETRETVAGFLATFVHFASPIALVYYPGRIGPGAMLVALIAAAISSRPNRLVGTAVIASTIWWFIGMTIAIALDRPIF